MRAERGSIRGRPRGDPEGGTSPRERLIATAARLFARQGFEGTSLKEVAEGAGVTAAMVAYYFRDKHGLLEAVVRRGLSIMLGVVRTVAGSGEPGDFVGALIRAYLATLVREPWLPQIIIREVISKETPLRQIFVEEFATHAVELVPARVAAEIEAGSLRQDLDPRYAILSLLGMCLFPFIAHPVLGPLLDYEQGEAFAAEYGEHVLSLFLHGAGGECE